MGIIYDIRSNECAQKTLSDMTGVSRLVWESYSWREREYKYVDDLVEDVIKTHGHMPNSYKDFEFIYFHVTTSSNDCESFRKYGIMDLRQAYLCLDSELRQFLEKQNIHINLDEQVLTYLGSTYDISFNHLTPRQDTEDYRCWSIGRKFYYDYTTCGFLSVWENSPYGGQVHRRPEILLDIDNLLGLELSHKWTITHEPYEIVAKVSGKKIVYDGDENQSEEEKVVDYLTKAYLTAFHAPTEELLLLNNNVQIPPCDTLEINPLNYWK